MELLLPVLIVVMVVMLIMQTIKQRKTVRQFQDLQSGLQPGDVVMTTAGLHGTVAGTAESTIDLEIAPGVVTTWDRRVVREKLSGVGAADNGATAAVDAPAQDAQTDGPSTPSGQAGTLGDVTVGDNNLGDNNLGDGSLGDSGAPDTEGTDPR
ncbi:preprotein translocase subunit YajC [Dietzia sp.]|uniref:preprotein translocase subunit YajC n=1 Tax=Dietzia sp. TaxID=1871616 RepID=UPI002FD8E30F